MACIQSDFEGDGRIEIRIDASEPPLGFARRLNRTAVEQVRV